MIYRVILEEADIVSKDISFDEWLKYCKENIDDLPLFREDLDKLKDDIYDRKDRKFVGYFRDGKFVGYMIYGYNFLPFTKDGKIIEDEDAKTEMNTLHVYTIEKLNSVMDNWIFPKLLKDFMSKHSGEKITLQAHTDRLVSFYKRIGFKIYEPAEEWGNLMTNF